jgi:RimJ/RimL family protein N-acetyltransferase/acyl carrier protein
LSAALDRSSFTDRLLGALGRTTPPADAIDLHLVDDLGFDSLELYEFQVVLEELCGVELPLELLTEIDSLDAAYEWYRVKVEQGAVVVPPPCPAPSDPGEVLMRTRRVRLRALVPVDYEWLYDLTTRDEHLVRWRDRGQTFRIEEWIDRVWAGVAAQFVAVTPDEGQALGLVTIYNHDARNRHARVAAIFDEQVSSPGWRLEGLGLTVNYAFEVLDLLKLYAEVVDFNYAAFASGAGRFFVEEGLLLDYEYAHGRHWPVHVLGLHRDRFVQLRDEWLPRSLGRWRPFEADDPAISPPERATASLV